MAGLSEHLKQVVAEQLLKINQDHLGRLSHFDTQFAKLKDLTDAHLKKGSQHQVGEGQDSMLSLFDEKSLEYTRLIDQANH